MSQKSIHPNAFRFKFRRTLTLQQSSQHSCGFTKNQVSSWLRFNLLQTSWLHLLLSAEIVVFWQLNIFNSLDNNPDSLRVSVIITLSSRFLNLTVNQFHAIWLQTAWIMEWSKRFFYRKSVIGGPIWTSQKPSRLRYAKSIRRTRRGKK